MHADNRTTFPLHRNHRSTKLPFTVFVSVDLFVGTSILRPLVLFGIMYHSRDISLGVVVEVYPVELRDGELLFDGCVVVGSGGEF